MNHRLATPDEFRAFYGREPPEVWIGIPYEEAGEIVAMAVIFHVFRPMPDKTIRDEAWGTIDARKPLPATVLHRTAKHALAALKTAGEPALYTICRPDTVAEKWLLRLGFSIDPSLHPEEVVYEGKTLKLPVWSMRLADV